MTDLMALADRVEALTGPCRETDAEIARAIGWFQKEVVVHGAGGGKWIEKYWTHEGDTRVAWSSVLPHFFTASLDAAMTLVPEGWHSRECLWQSAEPAWSVHITHDTVQPYTVASGYGATEPLATVAAALRARASKEPEA